MHARFAIATAALAVLTAAPAASADWTAPQRFAGPGAGHVFTAANRHGSEVLIWKVDSKRIEKVGSQTGPTGAIRVRIRLPDGSLGRATTISGTGAIVGTPQVGVDENGNATAVWAQAGRVERVMASFHPHGKPFGKPVEIGRSEAFLTARPALAVGRFGDAVIAWNDGRHIAVRRRAANAQCTPARHFACYRPAVRLRRGAGHAVTIGPLGSAYVAYVAVTRPSGEVQTRLRMVVIRRSGRRSTDHAISHTPDGNASEPAIAAVRPDGIAELAWRSSLPATGAENERAPILAATSNPGAVVTKAHALSTLPGDDPFIRATRQGEAIVSWNQSNSTPQNPDGEEVAYAVRPVGEPAFGPATTISEPGTRAAGQSLATDAAGNGIIAYVAAPAIGPAPGGQLGRSHLRPAGGVFGPAVLVPGNALHGVRVFGAGTKISAYTADDRGLAITDWKP